MELERFDELAKGHIGSKYQNQVSTQQSGSIILILSDFLKLMSLIDEMHPIIILGINEGK